MKSEADSLGEEQLGKLVQKKDEEEESVTERRREYIGVWSDIEEKDEHVACQVSALALAMTDHACGEAEM